MSSAKFTKERKKLLLEKNVTTKMFRMMIGMEIERSYPVKQTFIEEVESRSDGAFKSGHSMIAHPELEIAPQSHTFDHTS